MPPVTQKRTKPKEKPPSTKRRKWLKAAAAIPSPEEMPNPDDDTAVSVGEPKPIEDLAANCQEDGPSTAADLMKLGQQTLAKMVKAGIIPHEKLKGIKRLVVTSKWCGIGGMVFRLHEYLRAIEVVCPEASLEV